MYPVGRSRYWAYLPTISHFPHIEIGNFGLARRRRMVRPIYVELAILPSVPPLLEP